MEWKTKHGRNKMSHKNFKLGVKFRIFRSKTRNQKEVKKTDTIFFLNKKKIYTTQKSK